MAIKKIIISSLIILLTVLIFFFLLFKTNIIKNFVPTNIKVEVKDFLFKNIFESKASYINDLEKIRLKAININKIQDTIGEYGLRFFQYSAENVKIDETQYKLRKFKTFQLINGIDPDYAFGSSFIDFYKDNFFLASTEGKITFTNDLDKEILILKEINSNFKDIVNYEKFYDYNQLSIKDLFIHNDKIYLSYSNLISKDCYNTSILVAKLNFKFLKFKKFFEPKECVNEKNDDFEFNLVQSGGRMIKFTDQKMLFSTGDYRYRKLAQDLGSTFGKILEIDLNNGKNKILSYGHRNPQGLYYDEEKKYIISTEHGPKGGDEININLNPNEKIKNFGWPQASYGEHYSINEGRENPINVKKYKKYPLHKSHKDFGFEEPIKYYVPSIGISQIIKVNNDENQTFFVTSMKAKTIFKIKLDKHYNIFNEVKFDVGERIRDIISINNNKIIMFLENTPSLAILEKI